MSTTTGLIIEILSAIALFFIIFAMGAIILLARRIALLTDELRSFVDTLKGKIPQTADKVTEAAEEARSLLANISKISDLTQLLQAILLSSKKFAYLAGAFLAGLRTSLRLFLKTKKKSKKEVDKCGREQG
ncbi:hypothetical protein H5T88_08095 [bacterium]|nr:hypothetical protein [bacterium]